MSEFELEINARKYRRKLVTMLYNRSDSFAHMTSVQVEENLQACVDYKSKLQELNSKIHAMQFKAGSSEDAMFKEYDSRELYNENIRSCTALLMRRKEELNSTNGGIGQNPVVNRSLLKCPTAPLPVFKSLPGEDLSRFFTRFEEILGRYDYPEYDKLLLLKQQLSGRALLLVNSLEADKQGYNHAKELLQRALASSEMQKFNVVKLN